MDTFALRIRIEIALLRPDSGHQSRVIEGVFQSSRSRDFFRLQVHPLQVRLHHAALFLLVHQDLLGHFRQVHELGLVVIKFFSYPPVFFFGGACLQIFLNVRI
jgi:hypothetical protein